jgi:hypothetical protein
MNNFMDDLANDSDSDLSADSDPRNDISNSNFRQGERAMINARI